MMMMLPQLHSILLNRNYRQQLTEQNQEIRNTITTDREAQISKY